MIFGLTKDEWKEVFTAEMFIRTLRNPGFWSGWTGFFAAGCILITASIIKMALIDGGIISTGLVNFLNGMFVGMFAMWLARMR